jgi:DHA2 family integral membrane protein (MFS transporter)
LAAPPAPATATESVGAAIGAANRLGADGNELLALAKSSFFDGFQAGCLVAAGVLFAGAIFAAAFLPSRPTTDLVVARQGPP